jgi:peptide/nickel transport system substrate-binding protein
MQDGTLTQGAQRGITRRAALGGLGGGVALLGAGKAGAQVAAQTITAVMQVGLRVLDPVISTADTARNHGYMIYDTLLATDANFEIKPQMAEKWEVSADGKTYTFTLRDGLKWHDGAPVMSEDCIPSIKRWAVADKLGQLLMTMVDSMQVIDAKSFRIVLKEPTGLVLSALGKSSTLTPFMMPKRIADTPASEPIKEYIGSGPFRFVTAEFKPGVKAVYEKNRDYVPRSEPPSWGAGAKIVNVDRVEWVTMPDAMTTLNALINGEIDYVEQVPFDLVPMVEGRKDIKLRVLDKLGSWTYLRFNWLYPPFDNKLIRRAALYAIGQEDVLKALIGDPRYYRTCAAVFGCGTPFESSYGKDIIIPANPEKARELLTEAKYDGTPVIILQPTDNVMREAQPVVVAAQLKKAGFNVELQAMDWLTLGARSESKEPPAKGGWNISITGGLLLSSSDPLSNFPVAANGRNAMYGWPDVPRIEELRAQFARTSDRAEMKRLAEEMQKLVVDEATFDPLGQYDILTGYSTKLTGVLEAPMPLFWNVRKAGG